MKYADKKLKLVALATAAFISLPVATYAATTTMNATATFYSALTLVPTNMAFSRVDYSAAPTLGTDFVKLGANGAATYGGVLSADSGAAPAAGTVVISTGSNGLTVNISCSATAVIGDGAGSTLNVTAVEVASGVPGAFGANSACAGIGTTSTTMVIAGGGGTLHLGGEIYGTGHVGSFVGGAYSTATGGTAISVQVLYQ